MSCVNGCNDNFVFDEKYSEYICCSCGKTVEEEE